MNDKVAKDVAKTPVSQETTQFFSVPASSEAVSENEVKSNLIQDSSSTSNLATQKDPSKLDAKDFVDGTIWTTAGWTHTNPKYVAKSSKMTLTSSNDQFHGSIGSNTYTNMSIDFTIDKNQLAKNRNFLVGSIQTVLNGQKQSSSVLNFHGRMGLYAGFDYHNFSMGNTNIIADNQQVGHLIYAQDGAESDLYFVSDVDASQVANDITVHYQTKTGVISLDWFSDPDYSDLAKNGFTTYPITQNIITNSEVYQNTINKGSQNIHTISPDQYESWYIDSSWDVFGHYFGQYSNKPIQYVLKVKSTAPYANTYHSNVGRQYFIFNKDNQMTNQSVYYAPTMVKINVADNLTALDLMKEIQYGQYGSSKQSDGSYLICVKYDPSQDKGIDLDKLRSAIEKSYIANIQDPEHKEQIINNTLNYYKNNKHVYNQYSSTSTFDTDMTKPHTMFITDVTPGQTVSYTQQSNHIVNGIGTDGIEFYRHANLSYIDDVTNKTIDSDILTGLRNKGTDYKVIIPQGYLLNNPQNGINYKWNADHSQITYTFQDDQKQNEANPIVIHLTHKHSKISDSNQLIGQSTRTFTIVYPDKHVETIKQVIGLIRTGDLDEATNTPTYTPWTLDDASKSYVTSTVNGITTHTDKYIAIDPASTSTAPRFAAITLPRIAGYTAQVKQNMLHANMYMVSFVAAPVTDVPKVDDNNKQENNKTNDDIVDVPKIDTDNKQVDVIPSVPSVINTNDNNDNKQADWQIKGITTNDYLVSSDDTEYRLPIIGNSVLSIIKTNGTQLAFTYVKLNMPSDYILMVSKRHKMYQLTVGKMNHGKWQTIKTFKSHNYKDLMNELVKFV